MAYSVIDERSAKIVKAILEFAKTFVFKDTDQADSHESTTSILWGSYFNSSCDGTLPYLEEYGKKGFPNIFFRDYNLMENGVEYFQQAYLQNSLYIGNSSKRLQEVRESMPKTNADMVDPPFFGNVFEANLYYRLLFCEYGVLPNIARLAPDHGLLYYNPDFDAKNEDGTYRTDVERLSKYIDTELVVKLCAENRDLFTAAMENRAMRWDPSYHNFVNWMIVVMTIYSYLDTCLEKVFNTDLYDQYDIRNALYSFGITFLNGLPEMYQRRVLKFARELVRTKSTSRTLELVIKDIFGQEVVGAYKLYLVYGDKETISNGTGYDASSYDPSKRTLFFVKIPYNEENVNSYIISHPDLPIMEFDDVISADSYWDPNNDGNCTYTVVENKIKEDFGDGLIILPSKYIGVSGDINIQEQNEGAVLLFSLLHFIDPQALKLGIKDIGVNAVPLLYVLLGFYYLNSRILCSESQGDIDPSWDTRGLIQNVFATGKEASWHMLSFLTEINLPGDVPEELKSVFFSKAKARGRTLYNDIQAILNEINTVSSPTAISSLMTSIMRIYRELKKMMVFSAEQADSVSGKLIRKEDDIRSSFSKHEMAIGIQWNNKDTITKKVYNDNNVAYPYEGNADWGSVIGEIDYTREAGFTEFTEYKLLQQLYEQLFASRNNLPADVYYGADTVKNALKNKAPELYQEIEYALEQGSGPARQLLTILASSILQYLYDGGLEDGIVSFNYFSSGYLSEYASKLVEKFISYTVQLQVSGTNLVAKDLGNNYLALFDHLSKLSIQHIVLGDSFWGKAERDQTIGESRQVKPYGYHQSDFLDANDTLRIMAYMPINHYIDRYGITANQFGVKQFTKNAHDEITEDILPIWKWDSFETLEQVNTYVIHDHVES